ncbi:MAG: HlyD family secretion protein [Candidatus Gastranaerophilales bacterium]|nr:HlyD family secretion protein [Candidatus Gastranaerophilales bacterium]MCM1072687.1 HlyD family secretion protein [Bacteroides sp.]
MADEQSINETSSEDTRHLYEKKRVIVPTITAIVLLIFGLIISINSIFYKSTDDAFVEGHLITIAPRVSGPVIKLLIDDNQEVKKGDLLLEIDPVDYEVKLKQTESKLEEARAALKKAQSQADKDSLDHQRYTAMLEKGISSKQDFDNSQNNLNSAQSSIEEITAMIKRLEAEVEQAKLDLSYTKIYATEDGKITHRTVEQGNYVQVAQPMFALVPQKVWVVANFKETQVANMKKGQPVKIKIDAYGGKKFQGEVDSLQMASGAKASLFPPENAVGSYVKIVQRIPVKIVFTEDVSEYNVIPGMSVVPTVKVK